MKNINKPESEFNVLTTKTARNMIVSLTQSWRYLFFLSVLSYLSSLLLQLFYFKNNYFLFISSVCFLFTHYFLFRLWLDNHFFKILYRYHDNDNFDYCLSFLFNKKTSHCSMEIRWLGTKRLFSLALLTTLIQWLWGIISLLL